MVTGRLWDSAPALFIAAAHDPQRADDPRGSVMQSIVTKTRDHRGALKSPRSLEKRHPRSEAIGTNGLRSFVAALTAATGGLWDNGAVTARLPAWRGRVMVWGL